MLVKGIKEVQNIFSSNVLYADIITYESKN